MLISIVTAAYNAAATIGETVASVATQTHPRVEHIVIDGASRDATRAVVEAAPGRVSTLVSEPDQGIYDAMNKGLRLARGEVLATLNADDVYADPTVLAQVAEAFGDPGLDAVWADLVYVDAADPARVVRYWKSRAWEPGLSARGWMPAHPTFFARRRVYERLGYFDTRYKLQSDFDLTLRFLEKGRIRGRYIPRIWVRMKTGGASNRSVGNVLRGNLEALRIVRSHGLASPLFLVRKIGSRIPQFFRRP